MNAFLKPDHLFPMHVPNVSFFLHNYIILSINISTLACLFSVVVSKHTRYLLLHFSSKTMSSTTISAHSPLVLPWNLKSCSSSVSQDQPKVPRSFVWQVDDIGQPKDKINAPVIDLEGFFKEDKGAIEQASELLKVTCMEHGFFQVINHGIDPTLLEGAYNRLDDFFKLPANRKLKALKKPGTMWGLAQAHADRFSTNLPWKETLSFPYSAKNPKPMVLDYFTSVMGNDLELMG